MQFIKPDISIPFSKYWLPATTVSTVVVLGFLSLLVYEIWIAKTFKWGTDFAGGTEIQIQFQEDVPISKIRQALSSQGFAEVTVVSFGDIASHEFLIRMGQTSKKGQSISTQVMRALSQSFGEDKAQLRRVDEVGPKVGRELKIDGLVSVFLAVLGILIYVWFRFTPQFAPGAILALLHDVIVTLGVFALLDIEFSLPDVAALLTIVGYSVNDTIVVYDRIRDNLKRARRGVLDDVVVKSLNETLSRTFLTSLTTFMVVASLFAFSTGGIHDFALVLMIGIVVGTYSSLFIATPSFVWLEKRRKI